MDEPGPEITVNCRLAAALAQRMRAAREDLTRRWLDRIAARVALEPNRIFPTNELLDHVPLLVDGIAAYLENPAEEISADTPVIAKAVELGELRFQQGFAATEILKEYEILGGVLYAFLVRVVDTVDEECTRGELLACGQRLFRAVAVIQGVTTTRYLGMAEERIREREERLRAFNRMVSHELKNRIGTVLGAARMLDEEWIIADAPKRGRFVAMVEQNAEAMNAVLENLIALTRTDRDARQQRNVLLPEAAQEVVRQLREFARARGVEVRLSPALPPAEVNAAAVELCLTNYVSNAIKYSDPRKPERWVEVSGSVSGEAAARQLVVEVRDNGLGVPEASRSSLFQRFFRAHGETVTSVEGTGLGLSIVRETAESLGGSAWADFGEPGVTRFFLALPWRREAADAAAPPAAAEGG